MTKYRIETLISGYKVALECDEVSAKILLPRFSKDEPYWTDCRALNGEFKRDDENSRTFPHVVCFVDSDLGPKEHTWTPAGDGDDFHCVRGQSHKFVVNDDNENDCYCENCGIREW